MVIIYSLNTDIQVNNTSRVLPNSEKPLHALERSLSEPRTVSLPQTGGTGFGRSHSRGKLRNHMTTKHNLIISKFSFVLDGAHRTHAFDDEAIRFRCVLESLLAAPSDVTGSEYLNIEDLT